MKAFLKSRIKKDGILTHARIKSEEHGVVGGAYTIPAADLPQFYEVYYNEVFGSGMPEYMVEMQTESGPLVIDLDFRLKEPARAYTMDHVTDFLSTVLEEVGTVCAVGNEPFPVLLLEKDGINASNPSVIKDGIHLFLGLSMDQTAKSILRTRVLSKMSIWDDLQAKLTNSWDGVIDSGVFLGKTGWQLYGSTKPGYEPYKLTRVFTATREESGYFNLTGVRLQTFNIRENLARMSVKYTGYSTAHIAPSFQEEYDRIKTGKRAAPKVIIQECAAICPSSIDSEEMLEAAVNDFLESLDPIEGVKTRNAFMYAMCLPEEFYGPQSYDKWIRVGWAMKNTDPRLFPCWLKFSSQSPSFSFDSVPKLYDDWNSWSHRSENALSLLSIIFWARTSAPEKYQVVNSKSIDAQLNALIYSPNPVTETDYAELMLLMHGDNFACASIRNAVWFQYIDNQWREDDSGVSLYNKITDPRHGIVALIQMKIKEKTKATDEESKKCLVKLRAMLTEVKRGDRKQSIMRDCKYKFYIKNFMNMLDEKDHLLCCANGVVDFSVESTDPKDYFRRGKPDDYTSRSTNNPFLHDLDLPEVAEIEQFIAELIPDEDVREFMWDHMASILIGKNKNQTFIIYTGQGNNGKSKLVEFLGKVLGDYKATVPITLITNKRAGIGAATPEVMQLRGVRYAVMQEPSKGDVINEGIMKELTGGDPLQARALFKEPVTFTPQFTLVVCTNSMMDVTTSDEGTWRRIRVVDFKSLFKESPDPEDRYQFKLDKSIDRKFDRWKGPMLNMLIRRAIQTKGIVKDIDSVMKSSMRYRASKDSLFEYNTERLVHKPGKVLKESDMYQDFTEWFTSRDSKGKPPSKRELIDYITRIHGPRQKTKDGLGWLGLEFNSGI